MTIKEYSHFAKQASKGDTIQKHTVYNNYICMFPQNDAID